jgi:hypothetical protein
MTTKTKKPKGQKLYPNGMPVQYNDKGQRLTKSGKVDKRQGQNLPKENYITEQVKIEDLNAAQRTNLQMKEMMLWDSIDQTDYEQVKGRITEYLDLCERLGLRPGVSGLAYCLETTRMRLYELMKGIEGTTWRKRPMQVRDLVKRVYALFEHNLEENMQAGGVNPVTGIFLAKNHYDYRDQVEQIITPNNPLGETKDPETLKAKYLANTTEAATITVVEDIPTTE